ncbi:SMI1/KNR4 family protein [Polyangium jinanense]|uniref:SMI1/KNR4 family protein n=1 Tax=Polyangium jinanense TaxID=2829994 RepID=A0A9X4AU13_9BACT|nr:SMI1/KNR4 family protein [Polyangium jinanense]MDC3956740.1 SMI1/KNR4 family protein [Polyangium jinanense]MDC3984803.1 SMI1/KNR4 family protein [Polyangium jinanense]
MEITDRGEPLSEQALRELEEKLGVRLPEPYRRFLQEYNGGRPDPDILDIAGAPFKGADVHVFFGLGREYESEDLLWNNEDWKRPSLGNDVLAIACDSGGSLFGIVTEGEQRGRVYYFDYYADWEPYFVASDFDAFLQKLRAWTPEELAEIKKLAAENAAANAAELDPDKPAE